MKRLFSISLSILLLLQTANLGATNLLRFGDLIEHAQLHSDEYGDSFLEFITKHYGNLKEDHLSSHEGHDKLPFHQVMIQTTACFVVLDIQKIPNLQIPPIVHPKVSLFYANYYTSPDDQQIFQPPRFA